MLRTIPSVAISLLIALWLWPVAAAAQDAPPSPLATVEQVRDIYAHAGFQVEPALNWDWTAPPVSTFRVHDATRELMVLVYPSTAAAQMAASNRGSNLVEGYGPSHWRANVALVQTTRAALDQYYQAQSDRANGLCEQPEVVGEPASPIISVDSDFLQALDQGTANI